jgi:hypothetical protein
MRVLGSVVAGYVAMVLVVFAGLSLVWVLLGADRAFAPGTYAVTTTWILLSIVVGFIAALLGGWVSRRIGGTDAGPKSLAVVVVLLGVLLAIPTFGADAAEMVARTGDTPMFDAIGLAKTPAWVNLLNPVIGAVGVLIGGRVIGSRDSAPV